MAKTNRKLCNVCNTRPVATAQQRREMGGIEDMCIPCYEEGSWENTHSDNAHDDIAADNFPFEATTFALNEGSGTEEERRAAYEAYIASEKAAMADCWICHPELNQASADYTPRNGTSREGMTIHARGTGDDKAALVIEAVKAIGGTARAVRAGKGKKDAGELTLTAKIGESTLTLKWDASGRYMYGPSVFNSKKVRNVSEALRIIAASAATTA